MVLHDTIVVAHAFSNRGKLIENGTWIRGIVTGSILEILKAGALAPNARQLEFWHSDGEMFINHVSVQAGVYPIFSPQNRYLLFLGRDDAGDMYLSQGFRVTISELLEPTNRL